MLDSNDSGRKNGLYLSGLQSIIDNLREKQFLFSAGYSTPFAKNGKAENFVDFGPRIIYTAR